MTSERGNAAGSSGPPLTEREAEAQAHGIAFKTGPPGQVGVELEWLVCDGRDPALPVDPRRVGAAPARRDQPRALPCRGPPPRGAEPRRPWPRSDQTPTPRLGPAALRGYGRVLRPQWSLGPGHDVQHRLRPGVRGRRAGAGWPLRIPVALASAARAQPGAGGVVRQLPVPGRPGVRLEVDPAGGVVAARSQPDPGPRGGGTRRGRPRLSLA